MTIRTILQTKGNQVFTTEPQEKLAVVVKQLVYHRCGSLLVCRGEELVGIITERDILRASATEGYNLETTTVAELMTTDLVTGTLDDSISETMGLLTERRIRHLPILEDGKLAGMISIGDVVKAQYAKLSIENHYLKSYIQG
ncbi:MAG: CBS domain-containing protein [Planctomycetaceae bacterium]|jgi:CBS domain-containing protein|nr:CBS domain-containing protein [Planctomycetaceae bacterium]MCP4816545.1 CBS domain-containing protein [Planctomycetaceae bacterium]MEC9003027.1 CBS domain-containing protein [Planctomycetota bacterium]